jgi:hypothetical protein
MPEQLFYILCVPITERWPMVCRSSVRRRYVTCLFRLRRFVLCVGAIGERYLLREASSFARGDHSYGAVGGMYGMYGVRTLEGCPRQRDDNSS